MAKWEYKTLKTNILFRDGDLDEILNAWAEKNWEVVDLKKWTGGGGWPRAEITFKRQKDED